MTATNRSFEPGADELRSRVQDGGVVVRDDVMGMQPIGSLIAGGRDEWRNTLEREDVRVGIACIGGEPCSCSRAEAAAPAQRRRRRKLKKVLGRLVRATERGVSGSAAGGASTPTYRNGAQDFALRMRRPSGAQRRERQTDRLAAASTRRSNAWRGSRRKSCSRRVKVAR